MFSLLADLTMPCMFVSLCGVQVPKSFLLNSFLLFRYHRMDGSMFPSALDNVGIKRDIVKELMQIAID